MDHHYAQEPIHHDQAKYNQLIHQIEAIFHGQGHTLYRVKELAQRVREGIEKISPFIQQSTEAVCPNCTDVCCINKHGYYNFEDLVYIYALRLKISAYDFEKKDSSPCQFLSEKGCVMDRSVRPSGCNWYFCEPLFEHMESKSDYGKFDSELSDVAELWLELMDEFNNVFKELKSGK